MSDNLAPMTAPPMPDTEKMETEASMTVPDACPFDAGLLLSGNPFEGDYGDGEFLLSDTVGRVRESFKCKQCAEPFPPGEWARIRKEANADGITTYRWCSLCCQADLLFGDGYHEAYNARQSLGEAIRADKTFSEIAELRTLCAASLAECLDIQKEDEAERAIREGAPS